MLDTYRYKVDFQDVRYYIEIHEVLKRDLDFPDYYGGDPDALWDCLTDMLGGINYIELHNLHKVENKFPDSIKEIIEIFREVKHAYGDKCTDRFFVTIVHGDGTREEIEQSGKRRKA